jgi:hypothetical protein
MKILGIFMGRVSLGFSACRIRSHVGESYSEVIVELTPKHKTILIVVVVALLLATIIGMLTILWVASLKQAGTVDIGSSVYLVRRRNREINQVKEKCSCNKEKV